MKSMDKNLKLKLRRKSAKNEEKTLNRKFKRLFLWKRCKNMILNLEIKNYRSFVGGINIIPLWQKKMPQC